MCKICIYLGLGFYLIGSSVMALVRPSVFVVLHFSRRDDGNILKYRLRKDTDMDLMKGFVCKFENVQMILHPNVRPWFIRRGSI